MDMNVVGDVLRHQAKTSTLEKVNISLLKTANDQAEQQAAKIIESVAPRPEGNKGHNINISV